jgi:NADP oxidoreductase coenzyme F420-dependent.
MRIIIIGSGNTATVLGKAIIAAGHQVLQVAGRNRQAVDSLAVELGADSTTDLKKFGRMANYISLPLPMMRLHG